MHTTEQLEGLSGQDCIKFQKGNDSEGQLFSSDFFRTPLPESHANYRTTQLDPKGRYLTIYKDTSSDSRTWRFLRKHHKVVYGGVDLSFLGFGLSLADCLLTNNIF